MLHAVPRVSHFCTKHEQAARCTLHITRYGAWEWWDGACRSQVRVSRCFAAQARVTLVNSYVFAYFRAEAMPDVPQLIFEDRQVRCSQCNGLWAEYTRSLSRAACSPHHV
jgi:hypothetical protein